MSSLYVVILVPLYLWWIESLHYKCSKTSMQSIVPIRRRLSGRRSILDPLILPGTHLVTQSTITSRFLLLQKRL